MEDVAECLLVDDHEVVRAGMRTRLEELPWLHVTGEASTVRGATMLLRRLNPAVALMDLRLPDGSGLDLLQLARDEDLDTHIVVYSAAGSVDLVQRALTLGACGFVLKQSPFDTVISALDRARRGERYVDPGLAVEMFGADVRTLSPRERQILPLIASGAQNTTIAHDLHISGETVKAHVSNILQKLDAVNRTDAVVKAMRRGLID